jgi:hypothetical protein
LLNSQALTPELADDGSQNTMSHQPTPLESSSAKSCGDTTRGIKLYFFGAPDRIKVGVSRNVQQRLRIVGQHMSPKPILLGSIAGSFDLEHLIHGRLADHRLDGEWFTDCGEVRQVMERALAGEKFGGVKRRGPKPKPFILKELTPEEWLAMFNRVVNLIFPGDPVGGFAKRLDLNPDDVRDYLTGVRPFPKIITMAFGAVVLDYVVPPLKPR